MYEAGLKRCLAIMTSDAVLFADAAAYLYLPVQRPIKAPSEGNVPSQPSYD
jgi:hypothetical protein